MSVHLPIQQIVIKYLRMLALCQSFCDMCSLKLNVLFTHDVVRNNRRGGVFSPLFLSCHIPTEHTELLDCSQIPSQSAFQHSVYSFSISQQFWVSPENVEVGDRKESEFHFSKLKRRQDMEKKRKIRKIEWMRKM